MSKAKRKKNEKARATDKKKRRLQRKEKIDVQQLSGGEDPVITRLFVGGFR